MTQLINKEVEVNSFYFAGRTNTKMFPKQITVDGKQYRFTKSGIEMVVHGSHGATKLFTMSDGIRNFLIKNELGNWTLTSIITDSREAWA